MCRESIRRQSAEISLYAIIASDEPHAQLSPSRVDGTVSRTSRCHSWDLNTACRQASASLQCVDDPVGAGTGRSEDRLEGSHERPSTATRRFHAASSRAATSSRGIVGLREDASVPDEDPYDEQEPRDPMPTRLRAGRSASTTRPGVSDIQSRRQFFDWPLPLPAEGSWTCVRHGSCKARIG